VTSQARAHDDWLNFTALFLLCRLDFCVDFVFFYGKGEDGSFQCYIPLHPRDLGEEAASLSATELNDKKI